MRYLRSIDSSVQQICNAISEVLLIDVEVVDEQFYRVAGTGIYKNQLDRNVKEEKCGYIAEHIMMTGENCIIEHPGTHKLCETCPTKETCLEKAEIALPIRYKDNIVGVIGLICFTDVQKDKLLNNIDINLRFIGRMSDLIVTKINEHILQHEEEIVKMQLINIIDSINQGLIVVDETGKVMYFNSVAESVLKSSRSNVIGKNIASFLKHNRVLAIKNDKVEDLKDKFETITFLNNTVNIICNQIAVKKSDVLKATILIFQELKEVKKLLTTIIDDSPLIDFDSIIGDSQAMTQVKEFAKRISKSDSTVLIQGESGTGKELFARAIHYCSNRRHKAFVAINCSAIPESLLESELFGYEEGSFTGAVKGGKIGKFERAQDGTIFLDEIGDLPIHLQAKILRVLQEKEVQRIGSNEKIKLNVRIIAATNKDLERAVQESSFREDLYFRLNVIPLHLPSLRERKEDIIQLSEQFCNKYAKLMNKNILFFIEEVKEKLVAFDWPGNVRQLENAIEYSVNVTNDDRIKISDLPANIQEVRKDISKYNLNEFEKEIIKKALMEYGATSNGKIAAAKALGIGIASLYRKIAKYSI